MRDIGSIVDFVADIPMFSQCNSQKLYVLSKTSPETMCMCVWVCLFLFTHSVARQRHRHNSDSIQLASDSIERQIERER